MIEHRIYQALVIDGSGQIYGPFQSSNEAMMWLAEMSRYGDQWKIVPIYAPYAEKSGHKGRWSPPEIKAIDHAETADTTAL